MTYTSKLSIIPCRAEGSDKAEMVTQLLYGESFELLESLEKWMKIKISHDNYECFIDKKQFFSCEKTINEAISSTFIISPFVKLSINGKELFMLAGSKVPFFEQSSLTIEEISLQFIDAPYLWGGRSITGIDCSGYTQLVYRLMDVNIPRDAYQQAKLGEIISFVTETKTGDLAFFDNKEGKITHVGIILIDDENTITIIHASGKVRIDKLDHYGIYDQSRNEYSHKLRVIKRILD